MELPPLAVSRTRLADGLVTHLVQDSSFLGYQHSLMMPEAREQQAGQGGEQGQGQEAAERTAALGLDGRHGLPVRLRLGWMQQHFVVQGRAGHRHRHA